MELEFLKFKDIDINDPFFDSLKSDYVEFSDWFSRKSENNAYVFRNNEGFIDGFLFHKVENEEIVDVTPSLPEKRRIKIGTFKVNAHGTRLGERFLKKSLDYAVLENAREVYVTIFPKHESLVNAFKRYGFNEAARKVTINGEELVLVKTMGVVTGAVKSNYPFIDYSGRKFLLSLYPEWHTRLLPDSMLHHEDPAELLKDISHTNSIHKIYLTKMKGTENLRRGDILVIYRTTDGKGAAHYRSVATSVCVVEEVRDINSFQSETEFLSYSQSYSIFSEVELKKFYKLKNYPTIIRFCYNSALLKRVTRGQMIESVGIDANQYWGFFQLTNEQFNEIVEIGQINENLIINKA